VLGFFTIEEFCGLFLTTYVLASAAIILTLLIRAHSDRKRETHNDKR